jgi:hypothetical protein
MIVTMMAITPSLKATTRATVSDLEPLSSIRWDVVSTFGRTGGVLFTFAIALPCNVA